MNADTRTITVDYLARVEGEGALELRLEGDRVAAAQLRIFEPPRFFEALLRGRDFREAPDITARICGICPVAYQMSAVHALETLCGVRLPPPLDALRRLLYCGEWIESHSLHIHLLHLPDFLGYPDAVSLAREHPQWIRRGLAIKKAGNRLIEVLGGREIHPINVRVGGFYRVPDPAELAALRAPLEAALADAEAAVDALAGLEFPDFEQDYEFVALQHDTEYPMNHGRLVSSRGLDAPVADYERHLGEEHLRHSTALQSGRLPQGTPVHLGPLARYALNRARLAPPALAAARRAGLGAVCRNPFRSILVRAVEVVHALAEALRLIDGYRRPEQPAVAVQPRAGSGCAATEAPRGLLYHRYDLDAQGLIEDAKIVAPTSVNQRQIEADLRHFVAPRLALPDAALRDACERAIRSYDPCISCATHFLDLRVERR